MAGRRKYIKSSSGYVRKSLHQFTPDGNIYEHDYMTITEPSSYAPDQIPIYSDSNFVFTIRRNTNGQYNVVNGSWVKPDAEDNNEFWTSANVGDVNYTTTDSGYIKPYFTNLTDFAYYGSAVELIRNTITKIIKTFPAGIYISKKRFNNYHDENGNPVSVLNGKYLVENPFHIDASSESVGNVSNPYRYLCLTYMDYHINGTAISNKPTVTQGKINGCPKNGDLLRTVKIGSVTIEYYFVDGVEIACSSSSDILIKPQDYVINAFFRDLDDFGRVLLNRDSNPRYKASFDTYFESDGKLKMNKREYIWPIAQNGYNLEITDNRFKDYVHDLIQMATFYDEIWSDNYYRAMAHESVKNLDWTFARFSDDENIDNDDLDFSKMQMYMRIYGRQLDEIKRYIDGIGFSNNISYNQENNPTDYTLSDALELAGWEVKNLFSKDEGLNSEVLYNGESVGYTMSEANNEFLRRLKLNSPYIFSQKGTKAGLRTLLSLFGMEEGSHYFINEKIYETGRLLSVDEVEKYNTQKTNFNVTYQGEYENLSGIPVKEVNGKIVPWFDRNKTYDVPMYFEMAGGWDMRDTVTVKDINGTETDLTTASSAESFYGETQKYVKYVNDIDELLNLPNSFIENGDFVYVFNINKAGVDLEKSSHYFYIENVIYSNEIDYEWKSDSKEEAKGWYPLTVNELTVNSESEIGKKLLLYLSYKENTVGNNPHFGNKKYDGGKSWRDRFNSIFTPSIEKLGAFVGVDLGENITEETVAGLGFELKISNATDGKTFLVTDEEASSKKLNSKQLELTFASQYKEFVENYVLFYLTQIIPSTSILKVVYKPMDTVYGITINNR